MDLIAQLARELDLKVTDVDAAVKLIDEGNHPLYRPLPQRSDWRHG